MGFTNSIYELKFESLVSGDSRNQPLWIGSYKQLCVVIFLGVFFMLDLKLIYNIDITVLYRIIDTVMCNISPYFFFLNGEIDFDE